MRRFLACILLGLPALGQALVKPDAFDLKLDMQIGGQIQKNPDTEFTLPRTYLGFPLPGGGSKQRYYGIYEYGHECGADLRLLGSFGRDSASLQFDLEGNFQNWENSRPYFLPFDLSPVHRSAFLSQNFAGNSYHESNRLEFDTLFLKLQLKESMGFSLGRQSVNWATNYYFSPNDLFSPFSPADFLRLYKPGIDCLRATWEPQMSWSFEAVASPGYKVTKMSGVNVADEELHFKPGDEYSALFGRLHADLGATAFSVLGGSDGPQGLWGGSLERDLGKGWMAALEFNRFTDEHKDGAWVDASLGLHAQIGPSLNARAELASNPSFPIAQFYYSVPAREQRSLAALGLDWDSQSLWKLGAYALSDLGRSEGLAGLHVQFSLADEADLSASLSSPWRLNADRPDSTTSYELAPLSLNLQIRWVI